MPTNHQSGRTPRFAVAAAVLLVALAGCSDEEQLSDIVVRAGNEMSAASGNGVSAPPREVRVQTYDSVLRQLREGMKGRESEPGAEAAKLLIAQALLGQGDVAAETASEARRELLAKITRTRSRLGLQANRETLAHAYTSYDPAADLEQLDQSEAEIEEELAGLRATLADKQQRIETLQGQMDEQKKGAEEKIGEASKIRAEATDAGAVRRAELITRANEIERDADLYEKKYAEIQLRAQAMEDESNEVRIRIASAQRREELVREARDRIRASAQLLDSQSTSAQTDAQNLASELGAAFDALLEEYQQGESPSFEEAVAKYRDAANQAQQARGEVSTSAPAVTALAQHASANLHLSQADLIESLLLLAQDMATQFRSARFSEASQTLESRLKELQGETAELYEAAGSTYSRLGGDGLSERMQKFAGALRGEAPQPDAENTDAPYDEQSPAPETGSPSDGAASSPEDESSVSNASDVPSQPSSEEPAPDEPASEPEPE